LSGFWRTIALSLLEVHEDKFRVWRKGTLVGNDIGRRRREILQSASLARGEQ
jgi:hypothetical protein